MDVAFYVTLVTGVLALIGLVGIIGGAASNGTAGGVRLFRVGAAAMTLAGLAGIIAGLFGIVEASQLFGGLMMLIFGTSVSLPKRGGAIGSAGASPTI